MTPVNWPYSGFFFERILFLKSVIIVIYPGRMNGNKHS